MKFEHSFHVNIWKVLQLLSAFTGKAIHILIIAVQMKIQHDIKSWFDTRMLSISLIGKLSSQSEKIKSVGVIPTCTRLYYSSNTTITPIRLLFFFFILFLLLLLLIPSFFFSIPFVLFPPPLLAITILPLLLKLLVLTQLLLNSATTITNIVHQLTQYYCRELLYYHVLFPLWMVGKGRDIDRMTMRVSFESAGM